MPKEPVIGEASRKSLQAGINKAADAVKITLGAKGRFVSILHKGGFVQTTKDGVTVARSVSLPDPAENMGATFAKEAAGTTVLEAGDGTTLTTILLQSFVNNGMAAMESGRGFREVTDEIRQGVADAISHIQSIAKPADTVEILTNIATISANGDAELASEIAEACFAAGKNGVVVASHGDSRKTWTERHEGFQVPAVLSDPFFANTQKATCEFSDAIVVCVDFPLETQPQIVPILDAAAFYKAPIVICAPVIEGAAMATIKKNITDGVIKAIPMELQGVGEQVNDWLRDISMLCGATVISRSAGMSIEKMNFRSANPFLGKTPKAVLGIKYGLISGKTDPEYIAGVRAAMEQETDPTKKNFIQQRIAGLSGGVHVIHVGGGSQNEVSERKDRADDAIFATRAAMEEGYVPGGHSALLSAAHVTESKINSVVLESPFNQLLDNAGLKKQDYSIPGKVLFGGVDVRDGQIKNMVEAGIIDPAKVIRVALESASSIAIQVLTTDVILMPHE